MGHWGEGHQGHCHNLPIGRSAADPHPHPRCFWLPQPLAEFALLGVVFTASQALNAPANQGDESMEFVVVGKALGFVAVRHALEVVAMGYACASLRLAQVARLADCLPWYLHRQPMNLPSLPGQSFDVLCHHLHPYPPPHPHPPPPNLPPLHHPPLQLPLLQRHHFFPYPHRRLN